MQKDHLKRVLSWACPFMMALVLTLYGLHQFRLSADSDWIATTSHGPTVTTDPDGEGPRPAGPERVEGMLVVDLVDNSDLGLIRELNTEYGLNLKYNSVHAVESALMISEVPEERMPELLAALEKDERVESASPNYMFQLTAEAVPTSFPNDPRYDEQWHMKQIDVEGAWRWSNGSNVVVSVIDTGVAYRDFGDRFHQVEDLENTGFVPGYDFVNKRSEAVDDNTHGTHVAGTIAQSTNNGKGVVGVAWGASIMPVKVLSGRGSGTLADVADGIRFSADHGATVINMSLGGPFPDSTMANAVKYAYNKGSIVVCAAGNSSKGKSGYPAGYPEAVSVSAVNQVEDLTFYTNYGPDIDLAAPGGDTRNFGEAGGVLQNTIVPRDPSRSGYFAFQGTSMAAPHVAGVAALIASAGVTSPAGIEKVLKGTAKDMGEEGRQKGYGAGILNAEAAAFRAAFAYKGWQLTIAVLILGLVAFPILRRGALHHLVLTFPGAILGSSGLFFLPYIFQNSVPISGFLTTGLPSWDLLVLGAAHHGNPITFSCLIPMLLSLAVVEKPALRAVVAGLTAGFAAHLLFAAMVGSVSVLYVPAFLSRMWLIGNGLILVFLAVVLAEEQP